MYIIQSVRLRPTTSCVLVTDVPYQRIIDIDVCSCVHDCLIISGLVAVQVAITKGYTSLHVIPDLSFMYIGVRGSFGVLHGLMTPNTAKDVY